MRNILFEVSPLNTTTNLAQTLRMSYAATSADGVYLDSEVWLPCITAMPQSEISVFSNGQPQPIKISHGDLEFILTPTLNNEDWSNLHFDGAIARIYIGSDADSFASYEKVFEGTVGALERNGQSARLSLFGLEYLLRKPSLTSTYAGTGGVEGRVSLKGTFKPVAFGDCQNIEPTLMDTEYMVYQVNDGTVEAITAVYEAAISLGAVKSDVGSYAALIGLTLAEGEWSTCKALGLFRLGAQPTNKLTADVKGQKDGSTYVDSISTIVPLLLKKAGLTTSQIDQTSFNDFAQKWSYFSDQQSDIFTVAQTALYDAGGYLFPSSAGVYKTGKWFSTKATTALNQDRSSYPLVTVVSQKAAAPPNWKVSVGADKNYSVHSDSEISEALSIVADATDAAKVIADQAIIDAGLAQADATIALGQISDISSDGILDRAEKAILVKDYNEINAEKASINNSASNLQITTENTAYNNAFTALTTYLSGLSPAWNDITQKTAITRSTFNTNWTTFYTARQAVRNAIASQAATRASIVGGNLADTSGAVFAVQNSNISSSDANSSNLLQKTGGGTFTGDLDATEGAQSSVDLQDESGALLNDAIIKTNLGVASAISGQAATATNSDYSAITSPPLRLRASPTWGANFLDHNLMLYESGTGIEGLKPAELGSNVTETRVASAITGQSYFATGTDFANLSGATKPANNATANTGALADLNSVAYGTGYVTGFGTLAARANVRLGTEVYRANGTTVLADDDAVTALGVASSIVGQAATATNSDFASVTGATKPENNADVTASVTPYVSGKTSATISADHTGSVVSGQLPNNFVHKRFSGTTNVSASTTWSVESAVNCTATAVDGQVSITACTSSGSFVVKSIYGGIIIKTTVVVTKDVAAPPSTGSGGGTSVYDTSFTAISLASHIAISDVMTVKTGTAGTITFTSVLLTSTSAAAPSGTFNCYGKWQWRVVGGSFADVAAEVIGIGDLVEYEYPSYFDNGGSLTVNTSKTGLTASTNYEVRLMARRDTANKTMNFNGSATAIGS